MDNYFEVEQLDEASSVSTDTDTEAQDKPSTSAISECNCMACQGDCTQPLKSLLEVRSQYILFISHNYSGMHLKSRIFFFFFCGLAVLGNVWFWLHIDILCLAIYPQTVYSLVALELFSQQQIASSLAKKRQQICQQTVK